MIAFLELGSKLCIVLGLALIAGACLNLVVQAL